LPIYGLFMNLLLEVYAPWFPIGIGLNSSSIQVGRAHGGWNGSNRNSDGAVRGGHRILCAISGCSMHGVQASLDRILGAFTTWVGENNDS
jgi:hypothetical protein